MAPGIEPGTEQAVYAYLVVSFLGFSLQMKKGRSRDLPKATAWGEHFLCSHMPEGFSPDTPGIP